MTPEELRRIVARHGGTTKFATRLKVSTRIVQYWLCRNWRMRLDYASPFAIFLLAPANGTRLNTACFATSPRTGEENHW
jgi:hypothetical protein